MDDGGLKRYLRSMISDSRNLVNIFQLAPGSALRRYGIDTRHMLAGSLVFRRCPTSAIDSDEIARTVGINCGDCWT